MPHKPFHRPNVVAVSKIKSASDHKKSVQKVKDKRVATQTKDKIKEAKETADRKIAESTKKITTRKKDKTAKSFAKTDKTLKKTLAKNQSLTAKTKQARETKINSLKELREKQKADRS